MKHALFSEVEQVPVYASSFQQVAVSQSYAFCISPTGEMWKMDHRISTLQIVGLKVKVSQVAVFNAVSLLVSVEGLVFAKGKDPEKYGLLGIAGIHKLKFWTIIPALLDVKASSISVGDTHAATIDTKGDVYVWGNVPFKHEKTPTRLESPVFNASQVVCGKTYTCICTRGGYVHLFGEMGSTHKNKKKVRPLVLGQKTFPYTPPEMEQFIAVQVAGGLDFVAFLTDSGEVYAFDDCMDLVKMPVVQEDFVVTIAATRHCIYGLSRTQHIYKWIDGPKSLLEQVCCGISKWVGSLYMTSSEIKDLQSSQDFLVIGFEGEELQLDKIENLSAYNRSEIAKKILGSCQLGGSSDSKGKNDLERLFHVGENDEIIEGIIKCRIQHKQREIFEAAFGSLATNLMKEFWKNLKEYLNRKKSYVNICAAASIANVIQKSQSRTNANIQFLGFKSLKNHSKRIAINATLRKLHIENLARDLLFLVNGLYIKQKLKAFSILKDLEVDSIRKKIAASSIGSTMISIYNKILKNRYYLWKQVSEDHVKRKETMDKLLKALQKYYFSTSFQVLKETVNRKARTSARLDRVFTLVNSFVLKDHFDSWRRSIFRRLTHNIKGTQKIRTLTLFMRLDRIYKNSLSQSFKSLIANNFKHKFVLIYIVNTLNKHVQDHKKEFLSLLKRNKPDNPSKYILLAMIVSKTLDYNIKSLKQHFVGIAKSIKMKKPSSILNRRNNSIAPIVDLKIYKNELIKKIKKQQKSPFNEHYLAFQKPAKTNNDNGNSKKVLKKAATGGRKGSSSERRQSYDKELKNRMTKNSRQSSIKKLPKSKFIIRENYEIHSLSRAIQKILDNRLQAGFYSILSN